MGDACFSPASIALLAVVGAALQAAIIGLFWMGIRAYQGWIKDVQEVRDRALEINERAITTGEQQAQIVKRAVSQRGGRS